MGKFRFGPFEIQPRSGTLLRDGEPVRLAPQPFLVLSLLVEKRGELVTRDDIQAAVWRDGTTVEFDAGLNYCIRQIRLALGEDASQSQYIVTVPKRGYRLGVSVISVEQDVPLEVPAAAPRLAFRYMSVVAIFAVGSLGLWKLGHTQPPDPLDPATRELFHAAQTKSQSWDAKKVSESIADFRAVSQKYPNFAPALAEYANAQTIRGFQGELPAESLAEAEKIARAALDMDPNLPLAHAALGHCLWQKWMWFEGGIEFDRAVALGPDLAIPHQLYALYLSSIARHSDAIAEARRAVELEPKNPLVNYTLMRVYFLAGKDELAIEAGRRVREVVPDFPLVFNLLVQAHLNLNHFEEAGNMMAEWSRLREPNAYTKIMWLARTGHVAEAKALAAARAKHGLSPGAFVAVGDLDAAFARAQQAVEQHQQSMIWFAVNREWDGHREDPRYKAILLQMGLPAAVRPDHSQ
jgi:DNA-binding winged helix-turn-helix (wHTH) protein/tetratricopeptide (TPR) repeat protein